LVLNTDYPASLGRRRVVALADALGDVTNQWRKRSAERGRVTFPLALGKIGSASVGSLPTRARHPSNV
jgi:hypothetical protein